MLERMQKTRSYVDTIPVIWAWIILFYSVCNSAMVPPWIMRINANKYLRIAWRFFMQSLIMIPFAMYERRMGNEEVRSKYSISYVLRPENFRRLYFASFAQSFWFTTILFSFDWTYISHALVLGALSNFFLSVSRALNGLENHSYEKGGQALVLLGVLFIVGDSVALHPAEMPDSHYHDYVNSKYLTRDWYHRVAGDLACFVVSYITSRFAVLNQDLKNYYPSFLSMSLWFMLNFFNMGISAFFLSGTHFMSIDNFWGFFGLFSQEHLASFMYMSIILMAGMLISSLLIKDLFPNVIPAIAGVFESTLSIVFIWLASVQMLPGPLACLGCVFIMPGMLMIIIGHHELTATEQAKRLEQHRELEMRTLIEREIRKKYRLSEIVERPSLEDRQSQNDSEMRK